MKIMWCVVFPFGQHFIWIFNWLTETAAKAHTFKGHRLCVSKLWEICCLINTYICTYIFMHANKHDCLFAHVQLQNSPTVVCGFAKQITRFRNLTENRTNLIYFPSCPKCIPQRNLCQRDYQRFGWLLHTQLLCKLNKSRIWACKASGYNLHMKLQRDNVNAANEVVPSLRPLLYAISFCSSPGQRDNTHNNNTLYEYMCYNTEKQAASTFAQRLCYVHQIHQLYQIYTLHCIWKYFWV